MSIGRAADMSIEQLPDTDPRRAGGRFLPLLAPFLKNRSGSTAIEFTLLALPFSALVFAILESCISFAGQEVLANATDDLARQMRTGQLKPTDVDSKTKLHKLICDRLEVIVATGCPGLAFDLREIQTFQTAADMTTSWPDPKTVLGRALTKNVLRVTYQWPAITNYTHWLTPDATPGKPTTHFAMAVWQNEPFDD
jgi:hypothetical protein